ncbi:Alpha/Beta hydrolase protein [Clohesyomyces aquaticus]|uniref:Alpha/Beta hydrolase protein n=1 Tax=Clohesyomyces aquaticus TaxID=1231657 RepID=A0A1Y1YU68_9PLEO|nr:Alpha/Beta hydrolase protein [Clohesyomyces aquaticus]
MTTYPSLPVSTGYISFTIPSTGQPCQTFYKVIGDLSASKILPLVALHGGPGAGHNYLLSLTDLYDKYGIPVIFYDQIGCGNSTHFSDTMGDENFWTIEMFMSELKNVISHFGLQDTGYYILGQSWGGVLAASFASQVPQPRGLKKVVIASGPASLPLYAEGTRALLAELPEDARKTLEECDKKRDYESPEFNVANMVFMKLHCCRLNEWPEKVTETFENIGKAKEAYMTMQGPSEFIITGSLKTWEGISKAHNISVPTLLTNGRFDSVQDSSMYPWFNEISKVKWVAFEKSSHMAHWEERDRYMEVVGQFLAGQ